MQSKMADMATLLDMNRAYTYGVARAISKGGVLTKVITKSLN